MDNKNEYKSSPLGKIPNEWDVVLLSEISEIVRGGSPRPAGSLRYFNGNFIPWVTVASLTNLSEGQKYVEKTETALTEEGSKQSRILEKGTLVLANSGATLGVPKILGIKSCANDGVAALININNEFSVDFLYYNLQGLTRYFREVVAPGNGQPNLNTTLIGETYIPKPPIKEQLKISEILNTCDVAIEKLTALIKKKEQYNRSLMQDLLTGKVRFNEFKKGKWVLRRFGDLGETFSGLSGKSAEHFGSGDFYIPYMNVFSNSKINVNDLQRVTVAENEKQNKVKLGDVFFTVSSETPHEVGMSSVILNEIGNCFLNSFCFGFRLHDFKSVLPQFLRFYLRSEFCRKEISQLAQGSTRFNLSKGQLLDIKMNLPSSIKEQEKIASVLTNVEDEKIKLKAQLGKLKQQKKGLMQLLLTGRVRVKIK